MTAALDVLIGILSAVGCFVIVYALIRLPSWLKEIVEEDRATERSHVEEVLGGFPIGPADDPPLEFSLADLPDVRGDALAPTGHLIRFSMREAEILEHPDDCDPAEGCSAVKVIESITLESGQMQVQGLYRERPDRNGYERVHEFIGAT